ncbi:VolA/Pla-1 family phospholipase [Photobacterium phosphoreum]|uniref:VolA/Pla-1 family phospholipase n=1 Tax=Photobacterium phosphoreum TaxID=659 RepID=UPI000D17C31D|nr:VolA/Pla-1 family phospholipase [Photobacterium phosphoreum]PTB33626.1 lipase [Photobacterium phosphoreum]
MKIRSIALLVTSALSLVACKGNGTLDNQSPIDPNIAASLKAETKVDFDLLAKDKKLILPTYLAMDVQDGTLATEAMAKDKTNTSDPLVAMGQTDGWSTTQPITINFTGKNLDPSTAASGFYLIKSGDPTNPDDTTQPTRLTQQAGDFVVKVSGDNLIVILLKPLDPASNYMYAVTDDLKDINGQPVGMSNSYALLKSDKLPPAPALLPAQKITHATEEAFHGIVQKRDIIFSSWFTTLSSGDVLFAAKMATLQTISNQIATHEPVITGDDNATKDNLYKLTLPTITDNVQGSETPAGNKIYSGYIYLPYYLSTDPKNYLTTPWHSDMPSLAKIKYVLTNGSDADKQAIANKLYQWGITTDDLAKVATDKTIQIKVLTALKGKTLTLANGKPLDPQRLITRYSPVPKMQSVAAIQYSLIMPKLTEQCKKTGYSVTIFQHGVTSNKEQFVYSNPSLPDKIIGDQCRAIFAIDLPLHGDRGIGGKNASVDPKMFLNFIDLTVARDNLRQSVIDVVNLRAVIGKIFTDHNKDELGDQLRYLTLNNGVSFAGHSLGAITGVDVANIANESTQNTVADQNYFNINTVALANPGAEIPYLLLNSPSFGDLIKGGIVEGINPEFAKSCGTKNVALCYQALVSQLTAANDAGNSLAKITLNTMNDSFNKFAYAAQTVMDPVDPINLASNIPKNVSVLMEEMKNDQVIPNRTPELKDSNEQIYSPFTGTTPLIAPLSLVKTIDTINGNPIKNAVRFKDGYHTSILSPLNPYAPNQPATKHSTAVTNAMQEAVASFINSDGKTVILNNQNVITTFNEQQQDQ